MNKHLVDFLIGCFAALCAVFVPRMVAMLNSSSSDISFFNPTYVTVGTIFAVVIGVITAIFEQKSKKSAAETFMTALGIPALLAGALNTGTSANSIQDLSAENNKVLKVLEETSGIKIQEDGAAATLQPLSDNRPLFDLQFIQSAMAADETPASQSGGSSLGLQLSQKRYVIVLGKTDSKAKAVSTANELKKSIPSATAVQSNQEFLIIDNSTPSNKSEALLRAIKLQQNTGLQPYLLEVK